MQGASTRELDYLLRVLGLIGIDKNRVSRICKELDEAVEGFRNRSIDGACPYL
jgi:transposase-like protein